MACAGDIVITDYFHEHRSAWRIWIRSEGLGFKINESETKCMFATRKDASDGAMYENVGQSST